MDKRFVTVRVQDLYYKLNYKITKVIVTRLLLGSQTKPEPDWKFYGACGGFFFKLVQSYCVDISYIWLGINQSQLEME